MSGFEFDDSGFKEIEKKMKKAKEDVEGEVKLETLMNDKFMKNNTNYNSFEQMVEASELDFSTEEKSVNSLESNEWNSFVKENTDFKSWEEMSTIAGREYIIKNFSL